MAKAKAGKKKPAKKKATKRVAAPKRRAAKKPAPKKAVAKKRPAPKKAIAKKRPAPKQAMPAPRPSPVDTDLEAPAPETTPENPLAEVKEVFDHYDRNDNGFIESGELSRLLEALGAPPEPDELSAALSALDSNSSGKISWDEFKDWWLRR